MASRWITAIALVVVLLAVLLGGYVFVWGEVERGWYRGVRGGEPQSAKVDQGFIDALDWYRAFRDAQEEPEAISLPPGEAFEPGYGEQIATYIVATRPFVEMVNAAAQKTEKTVTATDEELRELKTYVLTVFRWRMLHEARAAALSEPLVASSAFNQLLTVALALPGQSLSSLERIFDNTSQTIDFIRARALQGDAAGEPILGTDALRTSIPIAVAGERAHVVGRVDALLETDVVAGRAWRREWLRLLRKGRPAPNLYRGARGMLGACDDLEHAATMDAGPGRDKLLRSIEERTSQRWISEWDSPDPIISRARGLLDRWPLLAARERITRIGVAALAYRETEGDWPADPSSLEKLIPGGLPVDPLTGQLFRFLRDGDELLLASAEPALADAAWTIRPPS